MKNYWFLALFGLAVAAFGQQAGENELACDCPSCREKAASGKEFTLPGLQGLEDGNVEQAALPEQDHAEEGHDHESDEGHDHDSNAGHQEGAAEVCCPHDEAKVPEGVPHDHDGAGVSDHASHDEDPRILIELDRVQRFSQLEEERKSENRLTGHHQAQYIYVYHTCKYV